MIFYVQGFVACLIGEPTYVHAKGRAINPISMPSISAP
jgi:hypothetical protein